MHHANRFHGDRRQLIGVFDDRAWAPFTGGINWEGALIVVTRYPGVLAVAYAETVVPA